MRTLRYPVLGIVLILAACASTPAPTITRTLPATAPSPTAARTATAAPAATNTARPTDLPSPTATASPAPSDTPTATPEPAPAANLDDWQLPLIAAGVTQMTIVELEQLAVDQPEGMLGSVLGLGISLGVIDDALEEWQPGPEQAGYVEPLRANLAAVGGVVRQWYDGEISAADVAASLRPVRASSEQVLGDLRRDLRRLGVSAEDLDALMAEIMAGL